MTFGFQKVKDVTMTPIIIKCCHVLGCVGTKLQILGGNTNVDGNEYLLVKRHNLSTTMETWLKEL